MKPLTTITSSDPFEPSAQTQEAQNYTLVSMGLQNAVRGLKAFWRFLKPVRSLIALGLTIGVSAAVVGDLLLDTLPMQGHSNTWWFYVRSFTYHAIKDVGFGLIVSSIAVFGFEYSKHARRDFERQRKLDGALVSLDRATLAIQAVEGSKIYLESIKADLDELRSNNMENAGKKVMDYYFSDSKIEQKFRDNINLITRYALKLKRTNTPDCQIYLEFIGWLCGIVYQNTRSLYSLENAKHDKAVYVDDSEGRDAMWRYHWPSTEEAAARISGYKMNLLSESDRYLAISNILFWEEKRMEFFMKQTEAACRDRGTVVRRVFNVNNFVFIPGLLESKFETAKRIVDEHLRLQDQTNGRYEIRFFGQQQALEAARRNRHRNVYLHNLLYTSFALFIANNGNKMPDVVWYRTEDEILSTMTLSRTDYVKYLDRFETIWEVCKDVRNPFADSVHEFKMTMGDPLGLVGKPL